MVSTWPATRPESSSQASELTPTGSPRIYSVRGLSLCLWKDRQADRQHARSARARRSGLWLGRHGSDRGRRGACGGAGDHRMRRSNSASLRGRNGLPWGHAGPGSGCCCRGSHCGRQSRGDRARTEWIQVDRRGRAGADGVLRGGMHGMCVAGEIDQQQGHQDGRQDPRNECEDTIPTAHPPIISLGG